MSLVLSYKKIIKSVSSSTGKILVGYDCLEEYKMYRI